MFSAISFINRAADNTKFNICIDNEWHDQLDSTQAKTLICSYEFEQDKIMIDNDKEYEPWISEVMNWFISQTDFNTIVMEIC